MWQHLSRQLNKLTSDLGSLSNDPRLSETSADPSSCLLSKAGANVTEELLRRVDELRKEGTTAATLAQSAGKKEGGEQQEVCVACQSKVLVMLWRRRKAHGVSNAW